MSLRFYPDFFRVEHASSSIAPILQMVNAMRKNGFELEAALGVFGPASHSVLFFSTLENDQEWVVRQAFQRLVELFTALFLPKSVSNFHYVNFIKNVSNPWLMNFQNNSGLRLRPDRHESQEGSLGGRSQRHLEDGHQRKWDHNVSVDSFQCVVCRSGLDGSERRRLVGKEGGFQRGKSGVRSINHVIIKTLIAWPAVIMINRRLAIEGWNLATCYDGLYKNSICIFSKSNRPYLFLESNPKIVSISAGNSWCYISRVILINSSSLSEW